MKFLSANRSAFAAIALFLAIFLFSCKKEGSQADNKPVSDEDAITYSEETTGAEASFDDIEDLGITAANEEAVTSAGRNSANGARLFPFIILRLRIGNCAQISVTPDDSTYPKTVTIDFGTGCTGRDGKIRKGAIILHFTGPIRQPGSILTITLRDFYLNRWHIEGSKVITNLSVNDSIKFTSQVIGGKVTNPGGRGFTYSSIKTLTQIEGGGTNDVLDDVYSITGRSETEYHNGFDIILNTESPLIKKVACPWISDGILKIKIKNRNLVLDYGAPDNGECDNKALLSWESRPNGKIVILP